MATGCLRILLDRVSLLFLWKVRAMSGGFGSLVFVTLWVCFGSSLSDAQLRILETSGALNVVIITDSDQAGEKARKSITKKCSRMFNIIDVRVPSKDVGDLSVSKNK